MSFRATVEELFFPKGCSHCTDLLFRSRQATLRLRLAFRAPPFKLDCRSANQKFFFAPFGKKNNKRMKHHQLR
ncbi:MAG: hypothetical protein IJ599_03350 [Alphaproteobacteria bacterium]|nr:hypothetical protein [Alphaproteobacteria bacterium]